MSLSRPASKMDHHKVCVLLLEGPNSLLFPLGGHSIGFSSPQLHLAERVSPTRLPKTMSASQMNQEQMISQPRLRVKAENNKSSNLRQGQHQVMDIMTNSKDSQQR